MFSFRVENTRLPQTVDHFPIASVSDGRTLYLIPFPEQIPPKLVDKLALFDKITLESETFQYIPTTQKNQTDRILVASNSGAGKSTWVNKYIQQFYEMFPSAKDVALFTVNSVEDSDEAFAENKDKINHIHIDETILVDPITPTDLIDRDSDIRYNQRLVIFDDYRSGVKKISDAVAVLRNGISELSRKQKIYQIVSQTEMNLKDGAFRGYLSNTTGLVVFPARTPSNLKYVLTNYYDFSPELLKDFKRRSSSRWILINRGDAPFILTETECLIYHPDREEERLKVEKKNPKKEIPETTMKQTLSKKTPVKVTKVKFDKMQEVQEISPNPSDTSGDELFSAQSDNEDDDG